MPLNSQPPSDAPDISAGTSYVGLEDISAIVAGYPGPALLVSETDDLITANAAAETLLATDANWWQTITQWRTAALAGVADQRSTQHEGPDGPLVFEWLGTKLSESRLLVLGRDVTLERRLRYALTESRQRFKDLVEISSDFAWETDKDGRFVFVSQRGALGFPAGALVGHHPRDFVLEDDLYLPLPFESRRPVDETELWLRGADGHGVCLQTSVKPLYATDGTWIGARGVCRDVTEQRLHSAELGRVRNRERVLNHIAHTLRDQLDPAKALKIATSEACRALEAAGCAVHRIDADGAASLAAAYGDPMDDQLAGGRLSALLVEVANASKPVQLEAGSVNLLACRTQFRRAVNGTVCVWRNGAGMPWDEDALAMIDGVADRIGVTYAHLAYQERLRQLSERDSLTGLFNRRTFLERLEEMLSWRDFGSSSLLYIDLDNFKAVNDLLGHRQGDEVLQAVAGLVRSGIRPGDLAARMGGDEFVLWLARTDQRSAIAVTRRLLAGMERLQTLSAGPDRPLGMSVGISVHIAGSTETAASLIERADTAMYRAKVAGKGDFCLAPARNGEPVPPLEDQP